MTLALNKIILMILLVILLLLLGISGVYGGYLLLVSQSGMPSAVSGLSGPWRVVPGLLVLLGLGLLPLLIGLRLFMKHKKPFPGAEWLAMPALHKGAGRLQQGKRDDDNQAFL